MKKITILVILFLSKSSIWGFTNEPAVSLFKNNSFIVEFSGHNRSLLSLNYEHKVYSYRNNFIVTLRSGIGYSPGTTIDNIKGKGIVCLPLILSSFLGSGNHFFTFGTSYTLALGQDRIDYSYAPPEIYKKVESAFIVKAGYRYYNKSGALFDVYPLLQWTDNPSHYFSWGFGLAIGLGW